MPTLLPTPTSQSPTAGRLLVCERTGQWAVALRRELADTGLRVWETRSLGECWESLASTPAAFLVVEAASAQIEELLRRMARLPREYPLARLAVVAPRALAAYEWLMREAGAVAFTCSPRQLGPLAQIALKHLAGLPPPPLGFTERILAGLPWAE